MRLTLEFHLRVHRWVIYAGERHKSPSRGNLSPGTPPSFDRSAPRSVWTELTGVHLDVFFYHWGKWIRNWARPLLCDAQGQRPNSGCFWLVLQSLGRNDDAEPDSEDCLYLNVFVPHGINNLWVMWDCFTPWNWMNIHGGGTAEVRSETCDSAQIMMESVFFFILQKHVFACHGLVPWRGVPHR